MSCASGPKADESAIGTGAAPGLGARSPVHPHHTKRTITSAMAGFSAGIPLASFAISIYYALKLYQPAGLYFLHGLPGWGFVLSLGLSLAAFCALLLAACFLAARAGFSASFIERALALAFGAACMLTLRKLPPGTPWQAAVVVGIVSASKTRVGQVLRSLLSRISLILAWAFVAVLAWEVGAAFSLREPPTAGFLAGRSPRLILLLLFDELDEQLAFPLRPSRIAIPNLLGFDSESLHASRIAPAAEMTTEAVPSLLTGHLAAYAEPQSSARLDLYGAAGQHSFLTARDTLFSSIRAMGLNSAALGWHHPYCRLFASQLAACESHPNVDATEATRVAFYYGQRHVTLLTPFVSPGVKGIREQYAAVVQAQYHQNQEGLRTLLSWLGDRRFGFIWAHFPCPHPPGMVSVGAHREPPDYFDNLALLDTIVGQISAELKANGRWDNSIVVITGDHGLRRSIWQDRPGWTPEEDLLLQRRGSEYVPVIVHLPGQTGHASFDQPLSALVLHDAILEWAQGRQTQAGALARWLTNWSPVKSRAALRSSAP